MQRTENLRDRKRREARRATERVAIELSLELGVDAVTVELICDRAGISPRTFYNYFGSRDVALLGGDRPMPTAEQVQTFVAREGVSDVEAFAEMMAQVWSEAVSDRELFLLRRRLLDATPDLAAANWVRINEARVVYAGFVQQRLERARPHADVNDLAMDAALVVSLAMSMLQVLARGWANHDTDTDITTLVHDFFPRMRRLTQTSPAPVTTA